MHFRMFLSETWSGILILSGSPITKQQVQLQVQLSCSINPLNCANTLKTSHHVGQNSQNNLHVTSSVCVDHEHSPRGINVRKITLPYEPQ